MNTYDELIKYISLNIFNIVDESDVNRALDMMAQYRCSLSRVDDNMVTVLYDLIDEWVDDLDIKFDPLEQFNVDIEDIFFDAVVDSVDNN